jgi:hypothetical protein
VLLSERLEPPAILKDLGGQEGTLRGSKGTPPFKLTFPLRTVILTDRPTLKWEKAPRASSYQVYVNDRLGRKVTRGNELAGESTEWTLPKPLKRGEIYVWTVVAMVNGKEIVSPGPDSPQIKFQVLSASSLQQLNQLKKTGSHLALGVFYIGVGMIGEGEHEFRELSSLNPKVRASDNLLRRAFHRRM